MNYHDIHEAVFCHNTNERPAIEDNHVISGINSIISFFVWEIKNYNLSGQG